MAHYILLLKHSVFYSKYQLLIPTFISSYVFVFFFLFPICKVRDKKKSRIQALTFFPEIPYGAR